MKLNSHINILPEAEEERTKMAGPGPSPEDHHRYQLGKLEEAAEEATTTPKLSLFSLPREPTEPPGMLTPPLHSTVSVPFQWEEAPGRPRPSSKPPTARCLELPPRLVNEAAKVTSTPSPTTVLDGPYASRSLSNTWSSFRIGGSFRRSPDGIGTGNGNGSKRLIHGVKDKLSFGSNRWGPLKEKHGAASSNIVEAEAEEGSGQTTKTKVKITRRVKRRGSLLSLSHSNNPHPHSHSHLLASIYESIKQAVPWRRKQKKKTAAAVVDDHIIHSSSLSLSLSPSQ